MSKRQIKWWLITLSAIILLNFVGDSYQYYAFPYTLRVDIPTALGIQVTLLSLLVVVGGFILAFIGGSKIQDIQSAAIEAAKTAAEAEAGRVAGRAIEAVRSPPQDIPSESADESADQAVPEGTDEAQL